MLNMGMADINDENARLKAEVIVLKRRLDSISNKLVNSNCKKKQLQRELKKKDVLKIILNKEQEQLLSNLSNDINILNLLSD
jgi:septal ring factor EnvC (AmiA/AmiB activator)